jgi:very-short-patch-repair endonuclease
MVDAVDRTPAEQLRVLAPDGVLSRAQLRDLGWDRDAVARQVRAGRWALHGKQTVALHTWALDTAACRWRAVWEVAPRVAALDGVTALQAAGLRNYDDPLVHVSVLHNANVGRPSGVQVHKVVRRVDDEVLRVGVPRTTPAVAAVRAAHWAVSNRQAALVMVMPVQQRLVTGTQLVGATRRVRGRTRRAFIRTVARDISDGAQSLGELDFAAMCRQRGLPEPSRQAVRTLPGGLAYLDVSWDEVELVVEIDGSQHQWASVATDDQFRQNALVIAGDRVLRMTLMGLRLQPERFLDQVCTAYRRFSGRSVA